MNGNYRRLAPYSAPIPDAPVQTHFVSPCGTVQYGGNSLFTMKWYVVYSMLVAVCKHRQSYLACIYAVGTDCYFCCGVNVLWCHMSGIAGVYCTVIAECKIELIFQLIKCSLVINQKNVYKRWYSDRQLIGYSVPERAAWCSSLLYIYAVYNLSVLLFIVIILM